MKRCPITLALFLAGSSVTSSWGGQEFVISTYAGGTTTPVAALNAAVGAPVGVASDAAGNVYFAGSAAAYRLDTTGLLTRIAGTARVGYSGDGGPAVYAQLSDPTSFDTGYVGLGLAIDADGNLYIADAGNQRVRRVSRDGIISTVAGGGDSGLGDGGPATGAHLQFPVAVAVDRGGDLFIADRDDNRIRKVTPRGVITTVAGDGTCCYVSGDGVPATSAQFWGPSGVAVDSAGNLFIADTGNLRIRKVDPKGIVTTVAGTGTGGFSGDGGPANQAWLNTPSSVAVDAAGSLFVADTQNFRIRKITADGIISTVAGSGAFGYSGDGGPAVNAKLFWPTAVTVDGAGNLLIADSENLRIRRVASDGTIATVAGDGSYYFGGDGGPATAAQFNFAPWGGGMAFDRNGDMFVADTANLRVRKISSGGIVTTVAGNGVTNSFSGDGGPATSETLNYPSSVAVDSAGNLYIADTNNLRVRKVGADGTISTVATTDLSDPNAAPSVAGRALAFDSAGSLYIGSLSGVRKLAPDGTISTVAGADSPAFAIAIDRADNLYLADISNAVVRKISVDGTVMVVAGNGTPGDSGDGGPATNAQLNTPVGLAVDSSGNLYIADTFNGRIRRVSPDGMIDTAAGGARCSDLDNCSGLGDGGSASSARFGLLSGLAIDKAGNLYASDLYYNVIRVLRPVDAR